MARPVLNPYDANVVRDAKDALAVAEAVRLSDPLATAEALGGLIGTTKLLLLLIEREVGGSGD
jgi:hypothetical protein